MWLKVTCVGGKTIKMILTKKQDIGYPRQQEGNPCQGRAREASADHSQLRPHPRLAHSRASLNNCSWRQACPPLSHSESLS